MRIPDWLKERRERDFMLGTPDTSRMTGQTDDRLLLADVAFNKHSVNDGHHVSPSDNHMVQIGTDGIEVVLSQGIDEDALKRTLTAATRATIGLADLHAMPGTWVHCQKFCDVVKKNQAAMKSDLYAKFDHIACDDHDEHEYRASGLTDGGLVWAGHIPMPDWEEMLKGGLQTALETQVIVFAVKGASRTCTHQLVRSRKAAFHQQSQRASYMGDGPECRMPESVWRNPRARAAFLQSVTASWRAYRIACEEDISYQDARFVLPEGTTNFIMLEYPIREFLNVYAYRACSMFQWEIVEVMRKCRDALVTAHPFMEPYVKISCEKTGPVMNPPGSGIQIAEHHCTFQGWESPEGQCDFPWAKDELRTFKPEFHQIGRRTGK
jgi:flavin-dependent thymidylate synthase